MGESRRHYDEEFKRNSVDLSYKSGKTVDQVAYGLGISRNILFRWRQERSAYGERAFPGIGKRKHGTDQEEEIRRPKKELADVQEENAILKNFHEHLHTNN